MENNIPDESNKLEYKRKLPDNNLTWLKTIVAFSNTAGGELVIGIEDDTKKVIGVDDSRSKLESKIMDTIYNGIEPEPIVNTVVKNIENKDVLMIRVSRGQETPYYVKSKGIRDGTYVRFGSSDRIATQTQIEELRMNKNRASYSGLVYLSNENRPYIISEEEIEEFLNYVNIRNESRKVISVHKLLEWRLIINNFDEWHATNGYMLLTTNPFNDSYLKVGIFKGTNKAGLMDEEIFTGSIIKQYEEVVKMVKTILNEGYNFKNVRTKNYLVPEEVIREIIANAIIHRSYNDEHPIRVEIYSDRMVVFSPGSLYDGLQLEDILNGISKLRNKNIAEIFYHLGYIEKWGSGIQRANEVLTDNYMNKLEVDTENIHGVTVTIYFEKLETNDKQKTSKKTKRTAVPSMQDVIEFYLKGNGTFKRREMEKDFNITEHQARSIIEKLAKENKIEMKGSGPATYYSIIDK